MAEDQIPIAHIRTNLKKLKQSQQQQGCRKVVLLSTGSYNPLHKMHVMVQPVQYCKFSFRFLQMFELAKEVLRSQHGIVVLGGFLSPSHDQYVQYKLEEEAIPGIHRKRMCQLAVEDSDWLRVSTWELEQEGFVDFTSVVRHHSTYLHQKFPGEDIEVFYLCGAGNISFGCSNLMPIRPLCQM